VLEEDLVNIFLTNTKYDLTIFILNTFFKSLAEDQWLELDIGHPTLVTGLVTKGRGDSEKNHWVTKYKVSYSNDSILWTFYKDANHLEPKVGYFAFFKWKKNESFELLFQFN